MPPLALAMNYDDLSDDSELSELSLSTIPSSPLSDARSLSPPPGWRDNTPPPSQDAGEDMPPARKRRKIEPRVRTTQHLDLTSDTAQSDYDRSMALETLLGALRKRRKIVVIAGAGISVSAGIPDFRSSHGLFRSLRAEHKLKSSGKELFDASVYKDDSSTSNFHDMVRQLSQLSQNAQPTLFHRLLARLSQEGRLLRLYTQNVDGLENKLPPLQTQVPLAHKAPWPKTIQLHGGLEKMVCQKCRQVSEFDDELFRGSVPPQCQDCLTRDNIRTEYAGKRSHGVGRLRPRIVLYNEHNPDDEAIGAVTTADFRTRPDAVIVVGTSMKIPAVRRITHEMCKIVRDRREGTTIWINHDPVPPGKDLEGCWDLIVKADADEIARRLDFKEWDDDSPEIGEDYTDSDIEKSRTQQGKISVEIPSPTKQAPRVLATPPMSPRLFTAPVSNSPLQSNITIKLPAFAAQKSLLSNPASKYKSLDDVLQKQQKNVSRKPSVKTGVKPGRPRKVDSSQMSIKFRTKVSKSTHVAVMPKKEAGPLSPRRDSNSVPRPATELKREEIFSATSSPYPSTPPEMMVRTPPAQTHEPLWGKRLDSGKGDGSTISPKGTLPNGMRDLLHLEAAH
jgi:NAD+-dependent protein deacetylase SIR2